MKIANYKQHKKILDYYNELHKIVKENKLNYKVIGKIENYEIGIITPKKFDKKLPNILIAGGFHGDEPAGTLGLLEYLKNDIVQKVNISFIPIVNPTGYMLNTRKNIFKEDPNRHYCEDIDTVNITDKKKPSKEGKILLKNLDDILKYSKDGFLTLHEDTDEKYFYIYVTDSLEDKDETTKLIYDLRETMDKYFKTDNNKKIEGYKSEHGIIRYSFVGAFEDYLFLNGVKRVICTETPAEENLEDRIKCNFEIINNFIKFYSISKK